MPRSAATRNTSRSRPSRSAPSATYTAETGMFARSASTTELRPAIQSASPDLAAGLRRGAAFSARLRAL